jgi:hypothetical protein
MFEKVTGCRLRRATSRGGGRMAVTCRNNQPRQSCSPDWRGRSAAIPSPAFVTRMRLMTRPKAQFANVPIPSSIAPLIDALVANVTKDGYLIPPSGRQFARVLVAARLQTLATEVAFTLVHRACV